MPSTQSLGAGAGGSRSPALRRYLRELRKESRGIPRRREVLREIYEHLEVGLAEVRPSGEEDVAYYLSQVGDPKEILAQDDNLLLHRMRFGLIALCLLACAALAIGLGPLLGSHQAVGKPTITMPHLVGMTEAGAESLLSNVGLDSTMFPVSQGANETRPGFVARQNPPPGTTVKRYSVVKIYFVPTT
jgi:hypothetical protein